MSDWIDRVDRGLAKGETVLVVLALAVMIGLAAVQFVLRKFFDTGFEWADIMVRQMVLWLGFIGGSLATHEGRHIAIDAVGKLLPPKKAAALRSATFFAAAGVTSVMVYAAIQFLRSEIDSGSKIFGEVPSWPVQAIIPVCFVTITFHFVVAARHELLVARGRREPKPEVPV